MPKAVSSAVQSAASRPIDPGPSTGLASGHGRDGGTGSADGRRARGASTLGRSSSAVNAVCMHRIGAPDPHVDHGYWYGNDRHARHPWPPKTSWGLDPRVGPLAAGRPPSEGTRPPSPPQRPTSWDRPPYRRPPALCRHPRATRRHRRARAGATSPQTGWSAPPLRRRTGAPTRSAGRRGRWASASTASRAPPTVSTSAARCACRCRWTTGR